MGINIRHTLGQVEGAGVLFAAGHIAVGTAAAALTEICPPIGTTNDVSVLRIGAGRYQVTIANFKGQNGIVVPSVTAGSTLTTAQGVTSVPGLATGISLNSYTSGTDTYSFTIGVNTSNTFVDADVYWSCFAF